MPRLPDAWDDEEVSSSVFIDGRIIDGHRIQQDTARQPALVGTAADNARLWQIA